jgi:hypothetical protein
VRLGEHREARRLFALARGVAPDTPKLWARWAVSCVPSLATRVWAVADEPEPVEPEAVADEGDEQPAPATPEPAK